MAAAAVWIGAAVGATMILIAYRLIVQRFSAHPAAEISPLAAEESQKRERILSAVAKVAASLLAAPASDATLLAALAQAGAAVEADRVILLEATSSSEEVPVRARCGWNAPGVLPVLPGFLEQHPELLALPGSFFRSWTSDQMLQLFPNRLADDFARFLQALKVQSFLLVPILVESRHWGYLIFDDCHCERTWSAAECDTLRVLAEIIAASVLREGWTAELSEAKRIVENSTTILYRAVAEPGLPLNYISANVSRWGYRPAQFTSDPTFYQSIIHPDDAAAVAARIRRRIEGQPDSPSFELRARLADGSYRWFENRVTPVTDAAGRVAGFEGTLTDIDDRKRFAEQLRKRDRILDAITRIAAELMAAPAPDETIPCMLHLAGEAAEADRVVVLENTRSPEGAPLVCERYTWNAPGVDPQIQPGFLASQPAFAAMLPRFLSSIPQGQIFTSLPRTLEGDFGAFLRSLNIQSMLLVPISIDTEVWGFLGIDDCHSERVWSTTECDALQVLADLIGASLARARRISKLSEAQQIVDNSNTVLFRSTAEPGLPLTYVSGNVARWGYQPEQFVGRTFHLTLIHPDDGAASAAWIKKLVEHGSADPLHFRLRFADGTYRWFENRITPIRDAAGGLAGFEGLLSDIDESKRAAEELQRRERILEAIAKIAAGLLAAAEPDESVPGMLQVAGEAIDASRVILLENKLLPDGVAVLCARHAWNAPGVEPRVAPGFLETQPKLAARLQAFSAALPPGEIFTANSRMVEGEAGDFLRSLRIVSLLLLPIFMEGELWGYLDIDDCRNQRAWTTAEREALQVLAGIIGASLARARYIATLSETQRMVENSTAVLYRSLPEAFLPVTYVSANVSKWGYRPEQFTESPLFYTTLVHPDDRARLSEWNDRLLGEGKTIPPIEFRIRVADGTYRWAENRVEAIRDDNGRLTGLEGMLIDITDRKETQQRLDFANMMLNTAMENSPNGFLVVDAQGRALAFNRRFLELWKIPPEIAAASVDELMLKGVVDSLENPEAFLARVRYLYQHPEVSIHDEIVFRDGRVFDRHSAALHDSAQQYLGRIWFFADITERKQGERELARLARTDALTGLANRATFLERLELMFAATRRGAGPFAVLYIDVDNFKDVNDTLGHALGDALLRAVAQRIAATVRATDLAARLGGDEFAVLQADAEDPSTAGTLAAKIRAALANSYRLDSNELRITATIGIALYSPEILQPIEILAQADRALYRAKEEGRDRYRFHSPELDFLVHERITLSDELRKAIERDELELHYQPQVDIATGRIVGVEALVRWNHPQRGQLKPGAFLTIAEKTGAIIPLGDWVLDQACQQMRAWRDLGVVPPVIAINLSGVQLKAGRDFHRKVLAALAKWGLAPEDLEFDVIESVLSASSSTQPDPLEQLRELGVRIAIDDFGSDYTSIGRVKAYHVKRFKIAAQFISAMTTDPIDAGVVRMMIHLARQLGVEIIAKSVETEAQRNFLFSLTDVAQAQGFYFSEPLDAARATELLRSKRSEIAPQEPLLQR